MTSRTALPTNPFRAPERALPAQTRLDEYEIERVLAQSSFGIVYRAYDQALKLHVAIKEYLPDALALRSAETQVVLRARSHAERFDQGLQAFIGEAQTLARCDHPSLLRILRVLQRHGTAYRVMRYTPGPTLLERRRELGAPPDAAALRGWFDALLSALETLHEEGCVHGAVAPGSILLLHGGRPLLLDFGAVRAALISDRTQSMMAALEPCFEPPEQREPGDAAAAAMGPWTDLYSLAATLHFCIGGQLPAPPSGPAVAFEPLADVWRRLQAAQPALGEAPAWLQVLDACLAAAVPQRPQSVAQVRSLLDALQPQVPRRTPAPRAAPRIMQLQDALPGMAAAPPTGGAAVTASAAAAAAVPASPGSPPLSASAPQVSLQPPPRSPLQAPAQASKQALNQASLQPPPFAAAPAPMDAEHAKVIADLDQTFAFIAAQANEEAAAPAPESAPDPQPEAGPAPAKPLLSPRQQLWAVGAVAALMLLGLVLAAVWLFKSYGDSRFGGATLGEAIGAPQTPSAALPAEQTAPPALSTPTAPAGRTAQTAQTAQTVQTAQTAQTAQAARAPQVSPPARPATESATPRSDLPPPPEAGRNASAAAPPSGTRSAAAAPMAPKAAVGAPATPREACGKRERYALLQCMETQCAKKSWSQHEQCVRLRKDRKL